MERIAIIGAGLAGLAAARALPGARLWDKGRAPGGRLATRRLRLPDGTSRAFDHGAQYLRAAGPGFAALLDDAGCRPWPDAARRVPVPGMSALPRFLAEGRDVATGRHVTALRRAGAGWFLRHADAAGPAPAPGAPETEEGPFDAVLVTLPAPQAIPLLVPHAPAMADALRAVAYAPCWTVMAAYPRRPGQPDTRRREGAIGWAARDSGKPGRDAAQENWVIQAGPDWTRRHLELSPEDAARALLAEFTPDAPLAAVAHRWRYSLLEALLGVPCLWDAALGLGYASDGCLGGRAEAAFDSGTALARAVRP